jgi:hypothetical protein
MAELVGKSACPFFGLVMGAHRPHNQWQAIMTQHNCTLNDFGHVK